MRKLIASLGLLLGLGLAMPVMADEPAATPPDTRRGCSCPRSSGCSHARTRSGACRRAGARALPHPPPHLQHPSLIRVPLRGC